ncbi:MAG: AAA family ATPase [Candidatus Pacebacteria bacterium]|nr:AAA family ATPase [Candidatus Paceibacterota bacterium]
MKSLSVFRPNLNRPSGRAIAAAVRATVNSQVSDQATELAQLVEPKASVAKESPLDSQVKAAGLESAAPPTDLALPVGKNIIAIGSGKGGVGKTFFSITLCQALASCGERVLLFDGDLGLANIDVQIGASVKHDLSQVVRGRVTMAQAVTPYPASGFDILAGSSGGGSLASLSPTRIAMLGRDLVEFAVNYDSVVMDLGAGVDRMVRYLAGHAGRRMVILTSEPTSMTDAYAFIKMVMSDDPKAEVQVVINQARTLQEGEKTFAAIEGVCERFLNFRPQLAGIVRRDRRVNEAIRAQVPILNKFPGADAAIDIIGIASRLRSQK